MNLNRSADAIECFKCVIEIGHKEGEFGDLYNEAIYFLAVCLELDKKFHDALSLFRVLKSVSPKLYSDFHTHESRCISAIKQISDLQPNFKNPNVNQSVANA